MKNIANRLLVAAFYKFIDLNDHQALQQPLLACCQRNALVGTILLAAEGINGTVAGSRAGIESLFAYLHHAPLFKQRFSDLKYTPSYAGRLPFQRMKVKLKREIVSMGKDDVVPARGSGRHVAPADWNQLITVDDVLVLDTRNHYEHSIGTFANAMPTGTTNFRDFPAFAERNMRPAATPRVAMFCTGGIRCEKASAWLLQQGFREVYQLAGGILRYLEEIPPAVSLWRGECFVFDNRVALDHRLEEGSFTQCYACRRPLSPADLCSPQYQQGISCAYCHDALSTAQRAGLAERRRQRHC